MKAFIILLVAVGLGSVVATIWVGSALRDETVVAQPYEEGLRYDETRRAAAVRAGLGDTGGLPARSAHGRGAPVPPAGPVPATAPAATLAPSAVRPEPIGQDPAASKDTIALTLSPEPARAMTSLTFTVRATRDGAALEGAEVALALEMPGMYMGENRVALAAQGGGVYRGEGTVVRCPSGKRTWQADVTARPAGGGAPIARRFTFEVADR